MAILEPVDNPQVKYHSSISQHKHTLCVMKKGEWCPIVFDSIDWIDCDSVKSHLAGLTDEFNIGYDYPVKECQIKTVYPVYHDKNQTVRRALPEYYGSGYYDEVLTGQAFINADNGALGSANDIKLRIGLNYAISDDILDPVA